jgi:hypothetical protein
MNARQEYALLHPLNSAPTDARSALEVLAPYRLVEDHPRGFRVASVLAVDR